jgi:hypothetical protein
MGRGPKPLFEKGKTYYEGKQALKIRYITRDMEGYYVFKILDHPELDEFCTKAPQDVYLNKTSYLKAEKAKQNQQLTNVSEMMSI